MLVGFDCFVPLKHSFLKSAVANRMAHKLFSLVRFDIHGGQVFSCRRQNDLNSTSYDRQRLGFDANFYASKLYVGSPNDVNFLFSVRDSKKPVSYVNLNVQD